MKNLVIASLLAVTASAFAQTVSVDVKDPWVRPTVAQQSATGAFMQITASGPAKVISASSPVAGITEIHEMFMDKDVMKMRAVTALPLPAGRAVELKPGGYHVMLMDLKGPVKAGEVVPINMTIETADGKRQNVEVKAQVRAMAMPAGGHGGHGSHGGHKH
ncbi:copper chaperone PCu(A)C [uncultured Hydrogenophaga sp.]|uniref:copper chaperone PCu(A)C n=1 Tax=uncultured Hydrogenophaga sp. TaxID=199683 RepID=UPI00265EF72F|nr:copper chaperone PCu(A)C [uncultured Hydrogenophaga sp.]